MNISVLDGFIKTVEEKELGVYGVHLYKDGGGSAQYRFRSDERVHLFSGSKAFVSMAAGIAEKEGLFSLDDSALSFFPQFVQSATPGAEEISLKNLLQMQSGHSTPLFFTDENTHEHFRDWAELFFSIPLSVPPGTGFLYDNGCAYILSRIVEAVSGHSLRNYLMPRLFLPLEIFNPQWHTCPGGHSLGAIGLYLTTEEFSRLGILLLNNGLWNEKRIIPENYIKRASNDTVAAKGFTDKENFQGYGYQLWRCTALGAFRADGKYGQYSVVLPMQRAVVTITAHNENNAYDILRAVWKTILPRIS